MATEYVVRRIHKDSGSTLNSIFADIAVQIENRDIYHMECQMNKDKGMVLRMLEYDIHIGLVHGIENTGEAELVMPRSAILYLNDTDSLPVEETCLIRFADGTTHKYRVPVMNVQSYTMEMIEKRHLNMLIPFLPIRFRKYLNRKRDGKKSVTESVRKDLTEFVRECIMIIDREKENGTLTDTAGKEMIEFLSLTCGYLLKNEPELKKEVHGIMMPIVMTQMERAEYEIQRIMQRTEKEKKMYNERNENAIRKSIEKYCSFDLSRQEVKENIQDIFSLDEAEAEEKMEEYWVQKGE